MHTSSLKQLGLVPEPLPQPRDGFFMIDQTKLAEMLCTRLCHDLTGPIGAVNNGAEFLSEEGFDMQNEAMQLILSSAHEAVNRLQFYRQAYGRVSETGEASLNDIAQTSSAFFSSTKIMLDWPESHRDASGISVSQKMARLVLNMLIITGSSLIRGGTIRVRLREENGEKHIHVEADGPTIKLDEDMKCVLGGDVTTPLTPKLAQLFLTMNLVQEIGATLKFTHAEQTLSLAVSQKSLQPASALM